MVIDTSAAIKGISKQIVGGKLKAQTVLSVVKMLSPASMQYT